MMLSMQDVGDDAAVGEGLLSPMRCFSCCCCCCDDKVGDEGEDEWM